MGASTPNEQFQEVISNMEKITEEIITTETVESEVQQEVKQPEVKAVTEEVSAKSEMEKAFDNSNFLEDWHPEFFIFLTSTFCEEVVLKEFSGGEAYSKWVDSVKDNLLIFSLLKGYADEYDMI